MGTFGAGLYQDDHALDIKSLYQQLRKSRVVGARAADILAAQCYEGDPKVVEDDATFWLVLADLQWKDGVLDERVASLALRVLNEELGLELWDNPSDRKERLKVYKKLLKQLQSTPPAPKIAGEPFFDNCPFNVGEVVAYQLGKRSTFNGRVVLLQVAQHFTRLGGISPVFELMNWMGERVPDDLPPALGFLNTWQLTGVDPETDEEIRGRISLSLSKAQAEGKVALTVTLEDVIRDKSSTRVPVVSFTGKEPELRRLTRLEMYRPSTAPDKILSSMVPYSWNDFESFVSRNYEEYYRDSK